MQRFTVVITPEPEAGGYSVVVPALPGCFSQGESIDEAIANAEEAIHLYLDELTSQGEPIPDDIEPHIARVELREQAARHV